MKTVTILKSQFSKTGGAEKYGRQLAQTLHARGHEVRVLTTGSQTAEFPFEVVSTTLLSKTSVSKLWEYEAFCEKFLRENPTDIILGLDRNRFQTHLRASSGVHKAYLEHRMQFEPTWKRWRHLLNPLHSSLLHIEKTGIEHPDLQVLFTNSQLVKQEILDHFVIQPEKICVVHNGVEWEHYGESFAKWEEEKKPYTFLFVGSDFTRKGLAPLLRGLSRLQNKNFHLHIVGKDRQEKQFKHLASKLQLAEKVTFHGAQQNTLPFLMQADCLVIPSYYDPFANVTVEALAMGLFVISSETNGGSEVLTPDSGIVFKNFEEELVYALEKAMQRPKTRESATMIRSSVLHLDFSTQLDAYLEKMQC